MKANRLLPEIANYEEVVKAEIDRGETVHRAGLLQVAEDIRNSLGGGKCVRCGKEWREVKVKNIFADYSYWQPNCNCYPKCKKVTQMARGTVGGYGTFDSGCGKILYEELDGSVKKDGQRLFVICMNCETEITVDRFIRGDK